MNIYVDFTIFSSPTSAYGNVSGVIKMAAVPSVGTSVILLHSVPENFRPFTGALKATSIDEAATDLDIVASLLLEDIVLSTQSAAEELASLLERECSLFCDPYED